MRVEQVMTRGAKSVVLEDSCEAAARIMWERDCGCVPVLDGRSRVVGMLTDRDICMAAYIQVKPPRDIPVQVAMSKQICTVKPGDSIVSAERIMREKQIRRLPVVDEENRVVGILSLNDISQEAARERKLREKEVGDSEVAETLSAVCAPRSAPREHATA